MHAGICFLSHAGLSALGDHREARVGAWFLSALTLQLLLSPSLAASSTALFEGREQASEMLLTPPVKSKCLWLLFRKSGTRQN